MPRGPSEPLEASQPLDNVDSKMSSQKVISAAFLVSARFSHEQNSVVMEVRSNEKGSVPMIKLYGGTGSQGRRRALMAFFAPQAYLRRRVDQVL